MRNSEGRDSTAKAIIVLLLVPAWPFANFMYANVGVHFAYWHVVGFGAASFGFRVAWINRFGQPAEMLPGEPQAELRSLAELPALLGL